MKRPDLRLVPTLTSSEVRVTKRAAPQPSRTMTPDGYQFFLPFDETAVKTQIVIVAMDHIHGVQLCRLILDLKPRTAVDLRHLIRFDLPGTSRTEIFQHFKNAHTLYVKASLPWHELQPRDFITDGTPLSQRLIHEVLERKDSPVLLFASKRDEARYLTAYLHRVLSSQAKHPWKIEQVI